MPRAEHLTVLTFGIVQGFLVEVGCEEASLLMQDPQHKNLIESLLREYYNTCTAATHSFVTTTVPLVRSKVRVNLIGGSRPCFHRFSLTRNAHHCTNATLSKQRKSLKTVQLDQLNSRQRKIGSNSLPNHGRSSPKPSTNTGKPSRGFSIKEPRIAIKAKDFPALQGPQHELGCVRPTKFPWVRKIT